MKNTIYNDKEFTDKSTLLGAYIDYMSTKYTAESFDFWTSLFLLSSIAQVNSYIQTALNTYRLNIYIFLLTNTYNNDFGRYNTNTAYNIMRNIDDLLISTSYTSSESFLYHMDCMSVSGKDNNIVCPVEDISTYFKNKNLIDFFSDMYNCPTNREGLNGKNKYIIRNAYFTILGNGTVMDYFSITGCSDFTDKLSSKSFIITASKKKEIKEISYSDERYITELIKEYKRHSPFSLTLSDEANKLLRKKYKDSRSGTRQQYGAREHELAVKLSGLFAINREGQTTSKIQVTENDLKLAYKLIAVQQRSLYNYLENIVDQAVTENISKAIESIRRHLLKAGNDGIKHNILYNKVRTLVNNDEFSTLMTILHEYGVIDKYLLRNGSSVLYMQNDQTAVFSRNAIKKVYSKKITY